MAKRDELPHDARAEEAVLGCLLLVGGHIEDWPECERAMHLLRAKDFYSDGNAWVFEAIKATNGAVDHITVFHELVRQGHAQAIDRPRAYLSYLISIVPTPSHAEHYARIVKDMAERRQAIAGAGKKAGEAWEGNASGKEFQGFSVEP